MYLAAISALTLIAVELIKSSLYSSISIPTKSVKERKEDDVVSFMEKYPDILMGTIIEKAVSQFMELSDEKKRDFLFS